MASQQLSVPGGSGGPPKRKGLGEELPQWTQGVGGAAAPDLKPTNKQTNERNVQFYTCTFLDIYMERASRKGFEYVGN